MVRVPEAHHEGVKPVSVNLPPLGELLSIDGIELGSTAAGIRYQGRDDLAVIVLDAGSVVGGVFTTSAYRAAPVIVASERLGKARALVINSGNANAATGERGLDDARASTAHLAAKLGVAENEVLPFSTGVIGEFLNMDAMRQGIDAALDARSPDNWEAAARAIMTTDTAPKAVSVEGRVQGAPIRATGMVKGSGMIRPDMATMLAFLGTDATLSPSAANQLARDLAERSFNRLTIDGDTSTNDSFVIMATGRAGPPIEAPQSDAYAELRELLTPLVVELAERTVRDGEGATKFVTITVEGGRTAAECLEVGYTIAHSPLAKTAIFAGDPNWGRFCMAIGRANIENLDPDRVNLDLDDVPVARNGLVADDYVEEQAAAVMAQDEFTVHVHLGRGQATETIWTSDLSYEYVRINAEYRS